MFAFFAFVIDRDHNLLFFFLNSHVRLMFCVQISQMVNCIGREFNTNLSWKPNELPILTYVPEILCFVT